jgi:HEAT repeat protein
MVFVINELRFLYLFVKSLSPVLEVRIDAIHALGESGDSKAVIPLTLFLDRDWVTHEAAAEALGNLRNPKAIPALLAVLRSDERQGGVTVARALGKIGLPALQPLLEMLKSTDDHVMRRALTFALHSIGPPAVEALLDLISVEGPVAQCAIHALGWIKDPRAVEPLIAIINTSGEKSEIINALGHIADPRATNTLIGLLNKSNSFFYKNIFQALYYIGDRRALPVLKQIPEESLGTILFEDTNYWLKQAIEKLEQQEKS